jgi:heterodisulfide reductase subunit D
MVLKDHPELKEQLYRCSKCGYCRDTVSDELGFYHVCPVYKNLRMEHYSGRGRTTIALGLSEGKIRFHKPLSEALYTCLSCGACKEICPEKIDVCGITRNLREEAFQRKLQPQKIQRLQTALKKTHNLFGEEKPRSKWAEDLNLPQKGETLYFAGCSASYSYPKTARASVKILQQTRKNVAYLGEKEWCCGSPAFWSGNRKLFTQTVNHNLRVIKASGAKEVVLGCAVCYNMVKTNYPTVADIPFKATHVSEFIAEALKQGKIKFTTPLEKKLTYHDPCHLGREEKVYEEPRTIIKKIPGVKYSEMERNRRAAWCCGEGVVVSTIYPNLTRKISAERIDEARRAGAEAIVTCCPGCVATLSKASAWVKSREGIDMPVYELPVIVAEAMGIKL